jgi:hypothetical protein
LRHSNSDKDKKIEEKQNNTEQVRRRQKTKKDRRKQKKTEENRRRQKTTEKDRRRQKTTEKDRKTQKKTENDRRKQILLWFIMGIIKPTMLYRYIIGQTLALETDKSHVIYPIVSTLFNVI